MTKRVNYADNIFFLNLILKQLITGARLNVDAGIFYAKIFSDLSFLDNTAESVFNSLKMDNLLIERLEYLKDLQRFNKEFNSFLEDILRKDSPFARYLEKHFEAVQGTSKKKIYILILNV
ncbi:hypothetical protein ES703_35718 [subsurface metagenome]